MFGFFSKSRRRQQLSATPLPGELVEVIRENVAVYRRLSPSEQQRLLEVTNILDDERPFFGIGDFEITDEVAVTVAAQAALLVLNGDGYYFDRVGAILIHASQARVRMVHPLGGVELVEEGVPIAGQFLEQGEVRLAWDEVLESGRDPTDGYNVVLHEFAHHLDWLDGELDGVPPLASSEDHRRWKKVLEQVASQSRAELRSGRDTFLPDHASDSAVELFAYATESFFERPDELCQRHPALFECLLGFYKTDPRNWFA